MGNNERTKRTQEKRQVLGMSGTTGKIISFFSPYSSSSQKQWLHDRRGYIAGTVMSLVGTFGLYTSESTTIDNVIKMYQEAPNAVRLENIAEEKKEWTGKLNDPQNAAEAQSNIERLNKNEFYLVYSRGINKENARLLELESENKRQSYWEFAGFLVLAAGVQLVGGNYRRLHPKKKETPQA